MPTSPLQACSTPRTPDPTRPDRPTEGLPESASPQVGWSIAPSPLSSALTLPMFPVCWYWWTEVFMPKWRSPACSPCRRRRRGCPRWLCTAVWRGWRPGRGGTGARRPRRLWLMSTHEFCTERSGVSNFPSSKVQRTCKSLHVIQIVHEKLGLIITQVHQNNRFLEIEEETGW